MIEHTKLLSLLSYSKRTGRFVWRKSKKGLAAGSVAGNKHHTGYRRISIDRKSYLEHRLAWFYVTGAWPAGEIDHKNSIRDDNRFSNLRDVSRLQNAGRTRPNNRIGRGVRKHHRKWTAEISHKGRHHYLGLFNTEVEAMVAFNAAARRLRGRYAVLNRVT